MTEKILDTIIIGAGITGLTSAYDLVNNNKSVLVLEKSNYLGGLLSSYHIDKFTIERYYHHFFKYDTALLNLIDLLNLQSEVVWKKASTGYYYKGEVYNLDTPREIFLYKYLSLIDKFKLALAVLKIKRMKNFRSLDKVTAREWLLANTSEGVYFNFFAPLLKSKFGSAADQISAAWLCARLKLRSNRKVGGEELGYLNNGFEIFLEKISDEILNKGKIELNSSVKKIEFLPDKIFEITTNNHKYKSRSIVSTIAPSELTKIAVFSVSYEKQLNQNKSQSVVCALFGMKEPLLNTYWLNIRSDSLPFALLIEHTNFHVIPEYANQRMIYVAAYQDSSHHPFYAQTNEEIIEKFIVGLEKEFGLKRENLLWQRIEKSPAVGPVYTVNFLENILHNETEIPGFFIGGMMTSYPERGISVSINEGKNCAKLAKEYLTK